MLEILDETFGKLVPSRSKTLLTWLYEYPVISPTGSVYVKLHDKLWQTVGISLTVTKSYGVSSKVLRNSNGIGS
jgi:hypothetical protein